MQWYSLPAWRQSPIPLLTGLNVEQLHWWRPMRYHYTKPPHDPHDPMSRAVLCRFEASKFTRQMCVACRTGAGRRQPAKHRSRSLRLRWEDHGVGHRPQGKPFCVELICSYLSTMYRVHSVASCIPRYCPLTVHHVHISYKLHHVSKKTVTCLIFLRHGVVYS